MPNGPEALSPTSPRSRGFVVPSRAPDFILPGAPDFHHSARIVLTELGVCSMGTPEARAH